jgi:hypothetical protein
LRAPHFAAPYFAAEDGELSVSSIMRFSIKSNFSIWYALYSSQSEFSISNGYGFTTDIRLVRQVMRNWDLRVGFSYAFSTFKSSQGNHSRQDLMLGLGLIDRFDGQVSAAGKSIGARKN